MYLSKRKKLGEFSLIAVVYSARIFLASKIFWCMGFEEIKLNERIIEKLKNRGITEPTEIQRRTFPPAANGHDIIGVSQTGSGKTLAFLLPAVQQTLLSDKPFHTLILVPTRELAQQIFGILGMFEGLNIRQALLSGGDNFNEQANALSKKPHIVVGTPGRVAKHIEKTKSFHVERIRKLILDEADRFFEQDFAQDLEIISKKLIKKNQTLMFTATLTDRCKNLASIFMRSPRIYSISEDVGHIPTLSDSFTFIPEKYKLAVLYNYLQEHGHCSIIVFVGLCSTSQKLGLALSKLGLSCEYLHGKVAQSRRIETVRRFRCKEFNVLISTDVASRGLDIPHVELVINFDLPDNAKIYTHRIGRTARAGKDGLALSLVTQYDVEKLQRIEHALKRKINNVEYKVYCNHEKLKDVYDEVTAEFNFDRPFKR